MSKNLDYIVYEFYNLNDNEIKKRFEGDSAKTEYVLDLSKCKLKEKIYSEIKEEVKAEAIKEARADIQKEKNNTIKKIAVEGFTISFLAGLSVNQITDLITKLKELNKPNFIFWTLAAIILFMAPAILLIFNSILNQITELMSKGTNDNENN